MAVSVALIARDEAERLPACLESVRWADEIVVVVDDRSSDGTESIARSLGARTVVRRFTTYAEQRQAAHDATTCDWVMWMDCDEQVSPELAAEIAGTLRAPRFSAYRTARLDRMFGRWIRHGGWYPQWHVRLWRRDAARWTRGVHERPDYAGPLGTLNAPMLHDSHRTIAHWIDKMLLYTDLEARDLALSGRRPGTMALLLEPSAYAIYKYFVQRGFLDGAHGVVLASLLGSYRLLRNLRWWDLTRADRVREAA